MSYTDYRPHIYSYQSRSRTRQYPRNVRTSIPGAGFDVKNLMWRDQPIDLSVGGLGAVGLGSGVQTATQIINAAARLVSDPDAYLRERGPALVAAAETHVVSPLISSVGRASAPYLLKYALPAVTVLYVLGGLSVFYSYKAAKKSGAL